MIRPMAVQDGAVWLRHDREQVNGEMVGGHNGVVRITTLRHPTDEHGVPLYAMLELPCPEPECPWMSTHPIGGGGLSEDDTRRLQQIFVEYMEFCGWPHEEALERADWLIASSDGEGRNLLHRSTATLPNTEESTMHEDMSPIAEEPAQDLGAAIIQEIDKTLATPFSSSISPLMLEILDTLAITRQALRHQTGALTRIKTALEAAAELRDASVT